MIALIGYIAVLGLLAFFEPCAIATHTLIAAQSHQLRGFARWRPLSIMWVSRIMLYLIILNGFVLFIPHGRWSPNFAMYGLLAMALVFLISRFQYIPIPHAEFFRLFPGYSKFSPAFQLGLTLPACTIPLFVIVLGICVAVHSFMFNLLAAFIFATLFSLPVFVLANLGFSQRIRKQLSIVAQWTPLLTSLLLVFTAFYFFNMIG